MEIKIDVEMQEYFNFNIGQFMKVLESTESTLIDKFTVESKIEAFKHARNKLTHLQYEVSKELELDRPQGIKATELPSETGADKGILTEEELNSYKAFIPEAVFNSHVELFKANAELSFNNQIAKEKIRDYFLKYDSVVGNSHAQQTVDTVLNVLEMLNIKIKDVNS